MQVNSNGSTVVYEDRDTVRCMVMNGEWRAVTRM
jgi:hypothetical protein